MKKILISILMFFIFIGCSQPTVANIDKNSTKGANGTKKYITIIKGGSIKKPIEKEKTFINTIKDIGELEKDLSNAKIDDTKGIKTESTNFIKRVKNIGELKESKDKIKKVK